MVPAASPERLLHAAAPVAPSQVSSPCSSTGLPLSPQPAWGRLPCCVMKPTHHPPRALRILFLTRVYSITSTFPGRAHSRPCPRPPGQEGHLPYGLACRFTMSGDSGPGFQAAGPLPSCGPPRWPGAFPVLVSASRSQSALLSLLWGPPCPVQSRPVCGPTHLPYPDFRVPRPAPLWVSSPQVLLSTWRGS